MAKLDTINWGGSESQIINVSASVGAHRCVNNYGDVMIVQALFRYLTPSNRGTPDSECPQPSGIFDKATARMITKFQAKYYRLLVQDGIVHPARDHKYQWGSHKFWTIALLNNLASDTALLKDEGTPVQGIFKRFPAVVAIVDTYAAMQNIDNGKSDIPFLTVK